MTPEDSYWLIQRMVGQFPGLVTGDQIDTAALNVYLWSALHRDTTLQQIAMGHTKEVEDELLQSQPSLPICPECGNDNFFVNEGVSSIRCDYCGQTWRALPMEREELK